MSVKEMSTATRKAIELCKHAFIKNHGTERCVHCGVSVQDWDEIQTELATQTMWSHM